MNTLKYLVSMTRKVKRTTRCESNNIDENKIREAIKKNEFISNIITDERFQAISRTIHCREVQAGETIIEEGENGSQLFVSALGEYEVITRSGINIQFDDVRVFGELALLYKVKRNATVRAITNGKLWVLDKQAFKENIKRSKEEERDELVSFFSQVPILNTASKENLLLLADLLSLKFFPTGAEIIKERGKAEAFYIIKAGSVEVKTEKDGLIAMFKRGQYFGQLALINKDVREATVVAEHPGCECLILSRKHFIKHLSEVTDLQKLSLDGLKLEHFRKIRTIGVGGFGIVDIVQHKTDGNLIYALKHLEKYKYELKEQRQHVLNERNIQINCRSPFIIRLFKTFEDSRFLYFLMDAELGGDLWNLMYQKRNLPFMEEDAKFYVGCVIEAFQYLHERGIIYRDLKPENLLIAKNGYVKLTDFGFAKFIGSKRTRTFVGTPNYMPPEIVCKKSHDRAVDCWTLGILIFELLTMYTPFYADSPHVTFELILEGINCCTFPYFISNKCENLIKKLCSKRPADRIGYMRNGMKDVKKHFWFSNFNWNDLKALKMRAPYTSNLEGPLDLSNFPCYEVDYAAVPEAKISNWNEDF